MHADTPGIIFKPERTALRAYPSPHPVRRPLRPIFNNFGLHMRSRTPPPHACTLCTSVNGTSARASQNFCGIAQVMSVPLAPAVKPSHNEKFCVCACGGFVHKIDDRWIVDIISSERVVCHRQFRCVCVFAFEITHRNLTKSICTSFGRKSEWRGGKRGSQ